MARILLVEDERNIRLLMALNLRAYGYEVVEAQDGTEALQVLQTGHLDLVITDLLMPNMSGVELIEWLKRERAHTPVIAVSADESHMHEATTAGADAILHKPFAVPMLLQITREVLDTIT